MFAMRVSARSRSLLRQPMRTCFIPLYGRCELGARPLPQNRTSAQDPHLKNLAWTNHQQVPPTQDREFPSGIDSQELRALELARQNRMNEVAFLFREQGSPLTNVSVVRQIAKAFARAGRLEDVEMIVKKSSQQKDQFSEIFFEANVMAGDVEGAKQGFDTLSEAQRAAVSPALEQEFLKLVSREVGMEAMTDLIKQHKITPAMDFHDANLEALLLDGKTAMGVEYLNFVRTLGGEPDARLLNKLIIHHVIEGNLDAAEEVLMSMKAPILPNLDSFHRLTVAHALAGNLHKLDYFLWRIGRRKLQIDPIMYGDILQALAFTGEHKRVEKTLYRMRNERQEPDLIAFNNILRGYADAGDFKRVNLTMDELRFKQFDDDQEVPTTPGQFLRPTAESYHAILDGYDKNGLFQHSVEMYRFMRGRNVAPLPETVPLIHRALEETKSDLPKDFYEPYDTIGKSAILSQVMVDEVSHLHRLRKVYEIEI